MKTILIMAQTLDGKIGRNSEEFIDWTGSADKEMFVRLTKEAGVIIMGSKTFDTIGKILPGRKSIVYTRDKRRISTSPDLIYTDLEPQQLLKKLAEEGYSKAAIIGGAQINTLFARAELIDEYLITIAPRIFGTGLALFAEELDIQLSFISCQQLDKQSILLTYRKKD